MDQFENFQSFMVKKSKLNRVNYNEIFFQLLYFGPHIVGRLGQIGGGCLLIGLELSNFKILEQFPTQNPN